MDSDKNICDSFNATPLQAGMLFNSLANPGSGVDVEHVTVNLHERIDVARFKVAWDLVITNRDALRSSFDWSNGEHVKQLVHGKHEIEVNEYNWSAKPVEEISKLKKEIADNDRKTGFDLKSPPLRLHIAEISEDDYWVLWSFHHIILDGRSFELVLKDVFALYDTGDDGTRERAGFSGFAKSVLLEEPSYNFWKAHYGDLDSSQSFGFTGKNNPDLKLDFQNHSYEQVILDAKAQSALLALSEKYSCSMNCLIQTAWALVNYHHTNGASVAFACTRAIRHQYPNSGSVAGLLINTLPFRVDISRDAKLGDLIRSVHDEQKSLRQAELCSLAGIFDLVPSLSSVETLLMYDKKSLDARMHTGTNAQPESREFLYDGQTNFPVTLIAYGEPEISLRLEYYSNYIDRSKATRILGQMQELLASFPTWENKSALTVPYLSTEELVQLGLWNDTARPYDLDSTLMDLFEAQVERSPAATALTFEGQRLSYREFNSRANKFARYLVNLGTEPDHLIGVFIERSLEMMVAIYAIQKAGGAYVPLDPEYPDDRLTFMIEDSGASIVIADRSLQDIAKNTTVVDIHDAAAWAEFDDTNPSRKVKPSNLAYMIYTSGSTGKPKGVMNEHQGIVNRLHWMQEAFELDSSDTVLQKTSTSFDVSVWELFWPLQVGAQLAIVKPNGHKDTSYLADIIVKQNVTTLHFVPSMLQLFVEDQNVSKCLSLKRVICSGEALPLKLQKRLQRVLNVELHNLYGPTEAAVDVTWWHCDEFSDLPFVPIGKSIANTQIHILDKNMTPVPIGVAGELHIGGIQVARGYKNRDDLTAERFVSSPFDPASRLYKTGDLARFLDDGNIEYLGRLDFQVKIRGQRIELGEIENVVSAHQKVHEVVVTADHDPAGEQVLICYYVGNNNLIEPLRLHCREFLADHMVPSTWVSMEKFPLNTSGKVDRNLLPAPDFSIGQEAFDTDSQDGTNESMKRVLVVWRDILGVENIPVNRTFFDVGGNSLSIIRLANKLGKMFNVDVNVPLLLRESTIKKQADFFDCPDGTLEDETVSRAKKLSDKRRLARKPRPRIVT